MSKKHKLSGEAIVVGVLGAVGTGTMYVYSYLSYTAPEPTTMEWIMSFIPWVG